MAFIMNQMLSLYWGQLVNNNFLLIALINFKSAVILD